MPPKVLAEQEREITRILRKNTLVSGICVAAGFSLLIPAFSVVGSKFEFQEFCFKPPSVPAHVQYCTGERRKKGISWLVALERANNQEFKAKVTMLGRIPAQNPNAGAYGLASAAFFYTGWILFSAGTQRLESDLDVFVWNKKSQVLERAFKAGTHLDVEQLKAKHENEFIRDVMTREHSEAMCSLMGESEREAALKDYERTQTLTDTNFEFQLASLKAQRAEQEEKEAKHNAETQKLNKSAKAKAETNSTNANEGAKEELIAKLKDHEDGWLYTLSTSRKPLYIEGDQGSFKSFTAAALMLCRYHLNGWAIQTLIDPHYHQNKNASWKTIKDLVTETYGERQNWEQVAEGLRDLFESWGEREESKDPIIQTCVDELTNYSLHDETKELAEVLGRRVISDPRKAGDALIMITHQYGNEGTGGSKGFSGARSSGTFRLTLKADDEMKPLFCGTLNGKKDSSGNVLIDLPITLPDWFRPEKISAMFKEDK
jgi:hypothetical protein